MSFGPTVKQPSSWAPGAIIWDVTRRAGQFALIRMDFDFSDPKGSRTWEVGLYKTEAEAWQHADRRQSFWRLSRGVLASELGILPGHLLTLPEWATFGLAGHEAGGMEVMPIDWPFVLTEDNRAGIYLNAEIRPGHRSTVETFKVGP